MRIAKSLKLAFNILLHSKLRSWLTILGIIIGIAAVVSIVSISQGAGQELESRLGNLGADILTITPGFMKAQGPGGGGFRGPPGMNEDSSEQDPLTSKDVLVLKNLENVKYIMGESSEKVELEYLDESVSLTATGVDESIWKEITIEELSSGRYLSNGDFYSVILGGDIVDSVFEDGIPLNSKVKIEGVTFRVVGILETGREIYMPLDTLSKISEDVESDEFDSISVKISDVELADETVEIITKRLMISRGILKEDEQDFTVNNPSSMQETMQETMSTMSLFLGAIAAISLLVGAIGIANTMFTSVLEKTKEIGIMKAIGSTNKDILLIFLFNSGMIGLVGGIGGIILGVFGSGLISYLGSSNGGGMMRMFENTTITPELLIFALVFSIVIGMIAGAIPAYRASRLNPVDALRYE